MTRPLTSSLRPNGTALGVRWLVLVVILLGTVFSSIGGTNSHGIAAIAATLHATSTAANTSHAHEDSEWEMAGHGATADHPHHGSDHSHDKAHALPVAWNSATPQIPGWFGHEQPWIETVRAYRLDRPPMG